MIEKKLSTGDFDALTLIHNETSCGVRNPLPAIAEVMRQIPRSDVHRRYRLLFLNGTYPDGPPWH